MALGDAQFVARASNPVRPSVRTRPSPETCASASRTLAASLSSRIQHLARRPVAGARGGGRHAPASGSRRGRCARRCRSCSSRRTRASRAARGPTAQGRYRVDSLPPGRYLMQISTPTLDSLDLTMPAREVRIAGGKTLRADAVLPFGAELRDLVCHSGRLGEGTVAVAGRVVDADTDKPLAGADVVAAWTDVIGDGLSQSDDEEARRSSRRPERWASTDCAAFPVAPRSRCGCSTADRAGPIVRLTVSQDEGVVVRDLSISPRSAPSIAAARLHRAPRSIRAAPIPRRRSCSSPARRR